jgi:hypothetical protein
VDYGAHLPLIDFEGVFQERWGRFDEAIRVLRSLLGGDAEDLTGTFYATRRVDAQMVEQARQVGCELRGRIRRRKSATPSVAAQVGNDHAMSGREMPDHRLEHFASDHQPMHEQEGWPRSALGESRGTLRAPAQRSSQRAP